MINQILDALDIKLMDLYVIKKLCKGFNVQISNEDILNGIRYKVEKNGSVFRSFFIDVMIEIRKKCDEKFGNKFDNNLLSYFDNNAYTEVYYNGQIVWSLEDIENLLSE